MATFTPPVEPGIAFGDPDHHSYKLMKFYGSVPTGVTVWQDQNLIWHQQQYPYNGRSDSPGLAQARRVYEGGHVHEIDDTQFVELAGAGYFHRINIADVDHEWKPETLRKLTKSQITTIPGDVVLDPPRINGAQQGEFTLASGVSGQSGGQRDLWLHDDILYSDFDVEFTVHNPQYGEAGRLQQAGICLRYQEDPANDRKRVIAINNNVFFFVPVLNVGVWSSNMAGTSMLNRQYGFPVESLFTPNFPYQVGIKLRDNIVYARIRRPGTAWPPWATDLTSNLHSKRIDLDANAGTPGEVAANPTPVGRGGGGWIAAHMGTNALIWHDRTKFINPDNHPDLDL